MSTYGPTIPNPSLEVYGSPASPVGPPVGAARTVVNDSNYVVLSTDRLIVLTAITSTRGLFLPRANVFPTGTQLWIQDESGSLTGAIWWQIGANVVGSDTINASSVNGTITMAQPYGTMMLESDGVSKWSGIVTSPTFAPWSDGSWTLSRQFGFNYPSAALAAARTWTLPAASAWSVGLPFIVSDVQGRINGANTLTVQRAGADTIDAGTSVLLGTIYSGCVFYSDGISKWTAFQKAGTAATIASTRLPLKGDNAGNAVALAYQSFGDASGTITDFVNAVYLTAALTAPRTLTLPAANKYSAGTGIEITDPNGYATGVNTLSVLRAGADTIFGSTASFRIIGITGAVSGGIGGSCRVQIISDGTSNWTVVTGPQMTANGRTYIGCNGQNVGLGPVIETTTSQAYFGGDIRAANAGSYDLGVVGGEFRSLYLDKTITAAGATGAKTINKAAGTIRIAAAGTTVVLTNSLITVNSILLPTLATVDGTAKSVVYVPAAGSATFTLNAAATGEVEIRWAIVA